MLVLSAVLLAVSALWVESDAVKERSTSNRESLFHSSVSERVSERELLTINSNNGGGVSERVSGGVSEGFDKRSPLYQHLPDCRKEENIVRISKKTPRKGLVCPMFRDEEGFLAEFVAYYQMHGIDHVLLFDHGTTDNSYRELEPWLQSGFVTILSNITEMIDDMPYRAAIKKKGEFEYLMQGKAHLEMHCKQWGQGNGYSYFFSVDIDEYLMPVDAGKTLMDAFDEYTTSTGRSILDIPKLNFQSTPHTLEPVDLLTIEAYQVRQEAANRMTYFKSVKPKVALRLNHTSFSDDQRFYTVECCTFHGCASKKKGCRFDKNVTKALYKGKGNKNWKMPIVMMHYSRTLEKYELKSKTWKTSSGEQSEADRYQIGGFSDRQLGVFLDTRASKRYGCQLREVLHAATGQHPFLRPGDFWHRNVEHGKALNDDTKNGSTASSGTTLDPLDMHGATYSDVLSTGSKNMYEYHGFYTHLHD